MAIDVIVYTALGTVIVLLIVYAFQINSLMATAPVEAERLAQAPLTTEDVTAVADRLKEQPIDYANLLPPMKKRRYVIVGGSGIIGGQIVLDLLAMGTPPTAVRIVDTNPPIRTAQFNQSPASEVSVLRADVTSLAAILSAFNSPWPSAAASLPLTVFHTVALIRPFERHQKLYHRCSRVNVDGTANVLHAAREAGAELFIYTSSCTAEHLPVNFFPLSPFSLGPSYAQVLTAADFALPMRPPHLFATNYARSKAEAERLVKAAGDGCDMRTGILRPGNAVYGHPEDKVLGRMLALRSLPSFGAMWSQSWIGMRNASLAHLQFEEALLGPHAEELTGKAFLVTDDGPPLRLSDVHKILSTASTSGLYVIYPPPLIMLLVAYVVEAWSLTTARFPMVARLVGELQDPVILFQPAVFSAAVSAAVDDSEARKPPEKGGIGYKPACTSLEGMTSQAMAHVMST